VLNNELEGGRFLPIRANLQQMANLRTYFESTGQSLPATSAYPARAHWPWVNRNDIMPESPVNWDVPPDNAELPVPATVFDPQVAEWPGSSLPRLHAPEEEATLRYVLGQLNVQDNPRAPPAANRGELGWYSWKFYCETGIALGRFASDNTDSIRHDRAFLESYDSGPMETTDNQWVAGYKVLIKDLPTDISANLVIEWLHMDKINPGSIVSVRTKNKQPRTANVQPEGMAFVTVNTHQAAIDVFCNVWYWYFHREAWDPSGQLQQRNFAVGVVFMKMPRE
jgi:hypothetical protein